MKITIKDVLRLEGEGDGWGLFGHEVRCPSFWKESADPYLAAKLIDETIVQLANQKKWDATKTFAFMNSKLGRWAGDEIAALRGDFPTNKEVETVLKQYMTTFEREAA